MKPNQPKKYNNKEEKRSGYYDLSYENNAQFKFDVL